MAKRVTNVGIQVEYAISPNYIRVTNVGVSIEYATTSHTIRTTNTGISVEYIDKRRKYGPSTGMML